MGIKYDLYENPDIKQTGEKQPLHPRVVFNGTLNQEEFLERVHKYTGFNASMLAGTMEALRDTLKFLLANGWYVEFGDIGYFYLSLEGPPVMDKKEVHAQSIKLKNINFRPSKQFKKEVAADIDPVRGASYTRRKGKGPSTEVCLALVMEHLQKFPCITRAAYCRMTGRDNKRAVRELNSFIEQGKLMRYGGGKQVVYCLPR